MGKSGGGSINLHAEITPHCAQKNETRASLSTEVLIALDSVDDMPHEVVEHDRNQSNVMNAKAVNQIERASRCMQHVA